MSRYRLVGAAAALAVMTAPATTPAMAQQVMSEPGYCAFFYPNANCQNKGPGNPYTGDAWLRLNQGYSQGYYVPNSGQTVGVARNRTHRSVTRMR